MRAKALGPFLTISFGLTWGIALLLILFPQQISAIFGEINYEPFAIFDKA